MLRILTLLCFLWVSSASAQTLLVLGDSLSAGYQMAAEQAWPAKLPRALNDHDVEVEVINASISGDTTANGLQRLPQLLERHQPEWVLIELGGNDGLRGWPFNRIRDNLKQLITQTRAADATPLLVQIQIPPNYGQRYAQGFADIYPTLAEQTQTPLLPFFMETVIQKPEWMRDDGIHPMPAAQPWIADFMAEKLAPYLSDATES
ncbi:multifunctional acyl-CoA thioesterase I/protease I/lysophospholipase L1 [Salinivibrio sp. PR6]|uniref:Multifunctional acyl-CoA thioesterase I/protease I/lysophospholipase L1 n=1 Tax=Salinivibrio kushneri TaxID=1908198 RepID=A0AB36K9U2_9GAMM|nr:MULTISPECIES: multifunctional acyl-CoA thioesterase I/protease I/lysophospholipase L1 [Salinivibrio]OOE45696.1 multifunctional acyl-CoA thioesterase I/protease I/lysophospholipase L1 [Salinivibrio kushneri]OOE63064.1 multifunctional acyl-CoA thioesterase I/protease I/lysophospholipase L1 [Salinivibrio sp. IB282]OOE84735.1 multifunctional acyl-CoA thioesterase I/protease I/lysophospholipase L1 [Salinivibrio sp. PR6]